METKPIIKQTSLTLPNELSYEISKFFNELSQKNDITFENVIFIVTNLMNIVGKYKNIKGSQKKELVISLLNEYVNKSDIEKNLKDSINFLIKTSIPFTIDVLVDVSKGKYKFKKGSKCLSCFIPCKK